MKVLRRWRYIDDIFLIWLGTNKELADFHCYLNDLVPAILLTLSSSMSNLQFLDVNVCLTYGAIHTELYTKRTDRNTLLHFNS